MASPTPAASTRRRSLLAAALVALSAAGPAPAQERSQPAALRPRGAPSPLSAEERALLARVPTPARRRIQEEHGARWLEALRAAGFDPAKVARVRVPFPFPFPPVLPRVTFQGGQPCYYRNWFFEKNVQARVTSPPTDEVSRYGDYDDPVGPQPGSYFFAADCEGFQGNATLVIPNLQGLDHPPIVFANRPPEIASFKAQVAGQAVVGATRGTVVELAVQASDPDGDPLTFTWAVNAGQLVSTSGAVARWRLPASRGTAFAYVLASDPKGGYREASVTVATDAGTVPAPPPAPPPSRPSDRVFVGDHFLGYFSAVDLDNFLGPGADSRLGSCRYYAAIGAAGGCGPRGELLGRQETFATWKARWGLDRPNAGVHATYANERDLDLERDMHGIQTALGTAYYVCNYPHQNDPALDNAVLGRKLVACVAMEWSSTPGVNGGQPFTKFLVFAPDGGLLQSVNLDGRGEKYLPGSCVVCHGARTSFSRIDERGFDSPALGAQFLPFDLDNFGFSTTRPALSRASQEAALRSLNRLLSSTSPAPAIQELVDGWYPTPASTFQGGFRPAGWAGHEPLYDAVVKRSCRTCHVAMGADDPTWGLGFRTFADFDRNDFGIASRVCGIGGVPRNRWAMPNSKVTFDRFWGDPQAVQAVQAHLVAAGEIQPNQPCVLPP